MLSTEVIDALLSLLKSARDRMLLLAVVVDFLLALLRQTSSGLQVLSGGSGLGGVVD